ncbi:MAG: hypothetical protein ACPG5T_10560, partial [Endozoicomonas sp.]
MEPDNRETVSGSMAESTILAGLLGVMPLTEVVEVKPAPAMNTACSYITKMHDCARIKPEPAQDPKAGKKRVVKRPAESPVQTAMTHENPEMQPALSSDFVPEASSAKVRIVESKEASSTTRKRQNLRGWTSEEKRMRGKLQRRVTAQDLRDRKKKAILDGEKKIITLSKKTVSKKYKTVDDIKKEFVSVPIEVTTDDLTESVARSNHKMPHFLRKYYVESGAIFISELLCYKRLHSNKPSCKSDSVKIVPFEADPEVVSVFNQFANVIINSKKFMSFNNSVFSAYAIAASLNKQNKYKQWVDNCLMEVERELKQESSGCEVIEHKVVEVGKESDVKKAEVIESSQQKSDWN